MWIDTSIVVGDQPVGLSVQRLDPDTRDRAAAILAWFSHLAMTSDTRTDPEAWQSFMQTVVFEHVKFTVPDKTDEQLDELSAAWWDDAGRQAIMAFIQANGLSPALKLHLQTIEQSAAANPSDRASTP
jgi:hypothetical protein